MRISDWSSDVCSSDLEVGDLWLAIGVEQYVAGLEVQVQHVHPVCVVQRFGQRAQHACGIGGRQRPGGGEPLRQAGAHQRHRVVVELRSEEHTSELQSLIRNSYAVFCLTKTKTQKTTQQTRQ